MGIPVAPLGCAPTHSPRASRLHRSVRVVSILLYVVSFLLPAVTTNNQPEDIARTEFGVSAFIVGPFAVFLLQPVWFANPAFWAAAGMAYRERWMRAAGLGTVAVLLGLSVLTLYDPQAPAKPRAACSNLSGIGWTRVTQLSIGYYSWVGSMAILAGGSLLAGSFSALEARAAWRTGRCTEPTEGGNLADSTRQDAGRYQWPER